jgi:hypothetical protein
MREVCELALKFRGDREGPIGKEISGDQDRQPDSGNSTVRDEKGGLRKRGSWWNKEPAAHTERVHGLVTLHLKLRAPYFYPNYYPEKIYRAGVQK